MGAVLDLQKDVSLFLDEMSLSAARQVNLSHLKIKTRLFVDQGLLLRLGIWRSVW